VAKKFDRELLSECAKEVLDFLALQDPMFQERIQITKDEYHLDDLQVCLLYCARTLDFGEHMWFSERAFMQPGYVGHYGSRDCQICGTEFNGGNPTDLVCSNQSCLDESARRRDEAFEKRASK